METAREIVKILTDFGIDAWFLLLVTYLVFYRNGISRFLSNLLSSYLDVIEYKDLVARFSKDRDVAEIAETVSQIPPHNTADPYCEKTDQQEIDQEKLEIVEERLEEIYNKLQITTFLYKAMVRASNSKKNDFSAQIRGRTLERVFKSLTVLKKAGWIEFDVVGTNSTGVYQIQGKLLKPAVFNEYANRFTIPTLPPFFEN